MKNNIRYYIAIGEAEVDLVCNSDPKQPRDLLYIIVTERIVCSLTDHNYRYAKNEFFHEFIKQTGLENFFFDDHEGLIRGLNLDGGISSAYLILEKHVETIEKISITNLDSQQADMLTWLTTWMKWARNNCKIPTFYHTTITI
jgi:hypothetical protein